MNSSKIKLTAFILMLTDHTAAALEAVPYLGVKYAGLFMYMRALGRAAFPLFAFLCAESCSRTKNIRGYLKRLLIFALISEVPLDLFKSFADGEMSAVYLESQNVLFTLALGVLCVIIYSEAKSAKRPQRFLLYAAILLCVIASELLMAEYGAAGCLLILALYSATGRLNKLRAGLPHVLILAAFSVWFYYPYRNIYFILGALLSAVTAVFYNGEKGGAKGSVHKWAFYIAYPAHILILLALVTVCF